MENKTAQTKNSINSKHLKRKQLSFYTIKACFQIFYKKNLEFF
jgi:hypothetical protein